MITMIINIIMVTWSRSCLTTGRVLLPEWVDGIARPHLAPLAISWAQGFWSRDYIWTALIFQTVSLFVEFSSFLPHLHDKKISVVGHRRDSNVDLLSTHRGQSRLGVLAVTEVLRLNNGEQHHQLLLLCSILSWSSKVSFDMEIYLMLGNMKQEWNWFA